jgi:Predicted sulfurtransferase
MTAMAPILPNSDRDQTKLPYVHLSGYKFKRFSEDELSQLRSNLKQNAIKLQIKGTILLGLEGLNFFLSGKDHAIEEMAQYLQTQTDIDDLPYKINYSETQPYTRMLVRIKNEIVTMGVPGVGPEKTNAPYISADQLHEWYEQGKEFVILDTRNDYEVALGKFDNAMDLDIKSFRDFPAAIAALGDEL